MIAAPPLVLRRADQGDVGGMHALIAANVADGHLLPRSVADLRAHVFRFVVAVRGRRIVGCAELDPVSARRAEVRSLAVAVEARRGGIGRQLVDELRRRAEAAGYDELCVMTHAPDYFAAFGFTVVPHAQLQEKVTRDCVHCAQFRVCGQFAMVVPLVAAVSRQNDGSRIPLTIALQVA